MHGHDRTDQSDLTGMGELLYGRTLSSVLRDDQRLGGKENSETSDACAEVQGVRLEAME
jgi:hypothetical protein